LNPLVGLYFACDEYYDEEDKKYKDGVVFVVDVGGKRVKFADSDTISLIANLARLSEKDQEAIKEKIKEANKKRGQSEEFIELNKIPEIERLMQFIRMEKPYFVTRADIRDFRKYFFVYPTKNNVRLVAQSGAFILGGFLSGNLQCAESSEFDILKIRIPAEKSKKSIKDELNALNINSRSLFPEIQKAAEYIKKQHE
jgi:hypothetical protein